MSPLTEAQLVVLRHLADGYDLRETASRLHLSYSAARRRRDAAMVALGANTTYHAIALCYERGILGGGR